MFSFERQIQVEFKHRVYFTEAVFCPDNALLRTLLSDPSRSPKVLVVMEQALADCDPSLVASISMYFDHCPRTQLVRTPLLVQGSESAKENWSVVSQIHACIEQFAIDRHSYLIVIGGGALLDAACFAAATAHRGVRHIRIPTTTLGQCDSGVGVKNAINAFGRKNFIGTFSPPFAVINDFRLLESLPDREKRSGLAEAVKVACIKDRCFFEQLERNAASLARLELNSLKQAITRCAELHIDHIANSGDPFEFGTARPLDFGHWSAHKLEQMSQFRLRHGEAVAIGIAIDTLYSHLAGLLDQESTQRVLNLLQRLGFELFAPELLNRDSAGDHAVFSGLQEFQEHLGGQLTLTLLKGLGQGLEVNDVSRPLMRQAIQQLQDRQSTHSKT